MMERVVFLDRDGTLNQEVRYLYRPRDLVLLPGVPQALKLLKEAGYRLVVVTNQAGVARGYYGEEDVRKLHRHMNRVLEAEGVSIDAYYYCPHHPRYGVGIYKQACNCRKPGTGMFEMAQKQFQVDKARSFMVGDKLLDAEAGKNYGLTSILVGTGYGKEQHERDVAAGKGFLYDYYAESMMEAARWILEKGKVQIR